MNRPTQSARKLDDRTYPRDRTLGLPTGTGDWTAALNLAKRRVVLCRY